MKGYAYLMIAILGLLSCEKESRSEAIIGEWKLHSYSRLCDGTTFRQEADSEGCVTLMDTTYNDTNTVIASSTLCVFYYFDEDYMYPAKQEDIDSNTTKIGCSINNISGKITLELDGDLSIELQEDILAVTLIPVQLVTDSTCELYFKLKK